MSIDIFEELWSERKATLDKSYQNTYTRTFIVHTTTKEATDVSIYDAIYGHANCPQIGDNYPGDSDTYLQTVSISPEQDDPQTWKVTCEYSSNPDASGAVAANGATPPPQVEMQQQGQKPEDRQQQPTLRPPDIKTTFTTYPEILKLYNSAGDPFVPPVTVEKHRPIFTIGTNVATINAYNLANYIGKVNSVGVTFVTGTGMTLSILAKTGKIKSIGTELILEGSFQYWRLTYEIEINLSKGVDGTTIIGWDLVLRDQGFRVKKDDGTKVPILDGYGNVVTVPNDLNGAGKKAAPNNTSYLTFLASDVYGAIDYRTLPGFTFWGAI